jgi:hypothetical protein
LIAPVNVQQNRAHAWMNANPPNASANAWRRIELAAHCSKLLADRDHAEVAVNIQADRSTDPPRQRHLSPPPPRLTPERENQRDNDTD